MWLCLDCYSLKSFGVLKSPTTYALEARIPLPQRTGVKSEISSSLQTGSLRQPTLSTLAQSSRRAEGSPQVPELAARPLLRGTVRPSDRRGLSLPSPTHLDRPARRSIEIDSAFHRMSQINGALLHVSGSARPESCWSAARHAQRRRFATGFRLGKALPPAVTEAANFDPGARAGLLFLSLRDIDLDHNSNLIGLIPFTRVGLHCRCSIPKRDGIPAPLGVCKHEIYL
jgi:hypothetical protein